MPPIISGAGLTIIYEANDRGAIKRALKVVTNKRT